MGSNHLNEESQFVEKTCISKPVKATKKLSFLEKVAYGMGGGGEVLMSNIIFSLAYPIYQAGLGIDARLIGLAVGLPRFWDAISDPLMGNISDNARTRWGRRRPFIFIGAIITGLLCMLLWMPPAGLSKTMIFCYFTLISILYFTSYTVFFVAYNGLGFELTSDYDGRTSVMSFKTFFMNFGGGLFLPLAFRMCFWFGDNKIEGVRVVGIIFGIAMICFGILPSIFCKERVHQQQKISFLDAIKYTLKNKPFMIVCGIILFAITGLYVAVPLQYYINMAYVLPGNESVTSKFMMYGLYTSCIAGFLSVPIVNLFSRIFGKRRVLQAGMFLVIVGMVSSWLYYTPRNAYLQLFFGLTVSPGMTCGWVILPALVADICDLDELSTGRRREGMFGAIFSFLMKAGVSLIMIASGYVVSWTCYNASLPTQSDLTIFRLRFMTAFVPVIFLGVALVLSFIYPLNKAKILEIQDQLRKKKQEENL
ncbi:MAG: hypothetical protein A2Y10_10130 [Planctomycetes bacterium GWF2_41_51]|nr:MAG: hypothetical protein A2Y10_10130 [Planctomycetes bacterium GWF2_41_51]